MVENPRPSKRARLSSNLGSSRNSVRQQHEQTPTEERHEFASKFNQGSIVRIKLTNFMTYKNLEVFLGPHLNMVLGPNGTGKSAVVCSIIVGLAGEVTLTGRASSVVDLIKNGERVCKTEIELYNSKGSNFIIERKITISKKTEHTMEHKNEWKLNGRIAKKSEVKEFIDRLNIKVDNLCQFLPQDSVTHFVKMNSSELLLNTLVASGDTRLVEDHKKLVDTTKEVSVLKCNIELLESSLSAVKVNYERSKTEVDRVRNRDALRKKQNLIRQKIQYLRYKNKKSEYDKYKSDEKKLSAELSKLKKESGPYEQALKVAKDKLDEFKKDLSKSRTDLKEKKELIDACVSKAHELSSSLTTTYGEYRRKENEEQGRAEKITTTKNELEADEMHLNSLIDQDCSRELVAIEKEINTKKDEMRELTKSVHSAKDRSRLCQREMDLIKEERKRIESVADKKAQLLRARFKSAGVAAEWLQQNQKRFRNRIYLPMMCEIDVKDPRFAKHVENTIPQHDLSAFVCENPNDLQLFTRCIREEFGLKVNVILAPVKDPAEYAAMSQSEELKQYGVTATLLDLVEAPKPILSYLCGTHQFHRFPVAERCSDVQIQKLRDHCQRFYVGSDIYVQSHSRYDRQKLTSKDRIKESQLLKFSMNKKHFLECQEKFKRAHVAFQEAEEQNKKFSEAESTARNQWQILSEKRTQLKFKHDERKSWQAKIEIKKKQIENLENQRIDLAAEKRKFIDAVKKFNTKYMDLLATLAKRSDVYLDYRVEVIKNTLLCKMAEKNRTAAQTRYEITKKDSSKLDEQLKLLHTTLTSIECELERQIVKTNDEVQGFSDGELEDSVRDAFSNLPDDDEGMEKEFAKLQANIETMFMPNDKNIMSEYKRQKRELQEKSDRLEGYKSELDKHKEFRDTIKAGWLPKLKEVIKVIDREYNSFMRKLNYDGQVQLDVPADDPENFAVYGIKIMVKYRDEGQLIPLSSTTQSGGERSVATMIYMLALQTVTSVPFRCVDEINQGMDPNNERKVFELLVKTADSSASQYFLVSPKLLPNLPYSDKMLIHIVYSGPHCQLEWNSIMKKGIEN